MGPNARPGPATRRRTTVAATVAVLTIASLSLLAWSRFAGPPPIVDDTTVSLDGLTLQVGETEWAEMAMVEDGRGGFMQPDSMMPGAPTGGQVRLTVAVTLANPGSGTEPFDLLGEFTMSGGLESEPLPLTADTVGELNRLGPGTALEGTLYFDVKVPDQAVPELPQLYLEWSRGGSAVRIPVQLPGTEIPEPHQH